MNQSQNRVGRPCRPKVRNRGSYKMYGPEDLKRALRMVHKGTSVHVASSRCRMPRFTIGEEYKKFIVQSCSIEEYFNTSAKTSHIVLLSKGGRGSGGQVFSLAAGEGDTSLQQSNESYNQRDPQHSRCEWESKKSNKHCEWSLCQVYERLPEVTSSGHLKIQGVCRQRACEHGQQENNY